MSYSLLEAPEWDPFADEQLMAMLAIDDADRVGLPDDVLPPWEGWDPTWPDQDGWVLDAESSTVADGGLRHELRAELDERLAQAADGTPGWMTGSAIDHAIDHVDVVSPDGQVDLLLAIGAMQSWLSACEARVLTCFTGEGVRGEDVIPIRRQEAAAALRVAPRGMPRRLMVARTLVHDLPAIMDALGRGLISTEQAHAAASGSWTVPAENRPTYEAMILAHTLELRDVPDAGRADSGPAQADPEAERADPGHGATDAESGCAPSATPAGAVTGSGAGTCGGADGGGSTAAGGADLGPSGRRSVNGLTLPAFRRAVEQARITADPAGAQARHEKAMTERDVRLRPGRDGIASLVMDFDAVTAATVLARINAATTELPTDDPRSIGEQRADLAADALLSALRADQLPTGQGRRPDVMVHVPLSTLLGANDTSCWVEGYGPVAAETVRDWAFTEGAIWHRLVTDPVTGHLVDHDVKTYRWSARSRRVILARHHVCAAPGCNQPGYRCDLDHVRPFGSDDGVTCACNGAPLCRTHHRLKTLTDHRDGVRHGPASYRLNPDGSTTWRLSTKHEYTSRPPVVVPPDPDRDMDWDARFDRLSAQLCKERAATEDHDYHLAKAAVLRDYRHAVRIGHRAVRRRALAALRTLVDTRREQLAQRRRDQESAAAQRERARSVRDLPFDAPPPF